MAERTGTGRRRPGTTATATATRTTAPTTGTIGTIGTEDRLRSLLAANRSVVAELALPAVLRRIVEAARQVAGARYAALGVIGVDGLLEQFVHSGMDAETVERIGALPTGRGVLGAVIEDAQPIRLHAITDDVRSAGFPPEHPPMRAFLGVPVRSRGDVFGNLYLADRLDDSDFTQDDEDLVVALAASAGVAIENARLYEESRSRQEWLRASAEISRDLLRPGLGADVLVRIADAVLRLADAVVVAIAFPRAGRGGPAPDATELVLEVARGEGAVELVGTSYPAASSLAGAAMRERRAVLADGPGVDDPAERHHGLGGTGPSMACPLVGEEGVRGAIVVARGAGSRPFGPADVDMAEQFAAHAAVALELADGRTDEERLAVLGDRHRIARDLHDHVIQRIFATGLQLEAAGKRAGEGPLRTVLDRAVEDLDETIREIRDSIFDLQEPPDSPDGRVLLHSVVRAAASGLGFEPVLRLEGPVATALDPALLHDVTAVLREALSNVVKHARATAVDVRVVVTVDAVTVEITDDGPLDTTEREPAASPGSRPPTAGDWPT